MSIKPEYEYEIINDKECILLKYNGNIEKIDSYGWHYASELEKLVVPSSIDGYSVVKIGSCCFNSQIKNIVIPEGVKTLSGCFTMCTSLESIELPNSITEIDDLTLGNCFNLKSINLPSNLKTIGEHAFHGCSRLEKIEIPSSVHHIGKHAFLGCKNLSVYCYSNNLKKEAFEGVKEVIFIESK